EGLGGGEAASSAGMLGRGDAVNRFNLFDNNSAIPTNRVWFTYELMQRFNTGLTTTPPGGTTFATVRDVNLYRLGAEIKLCNQFSIAFQDQYVASEGTDLNADAWANPEIMAKWAFFLSNTHVLAATLGIQPQVSTSPFELHEKDTRFLPG